MSTDQLVCPSDRLQGLKENWKSDVVSGFILFLIALPLSLGIAMASGVPPLAGIIAAVVGGLLVSQISNSQMVINGPAAGLIVVILAAVERLGGGSEGYHCALAAIVVAGLILLLLGLARAGELGYFFPSSVIHGMLAAIGLIIMIKQFPVMLGAKAAVKEPLSLFLHIPQVVAGANPEVALIGIVCLVLLIGHAMLRSGWLKRLPAPILMVTVAIGLGQLFRLDSRHTYAFAGQIFNLDPSKILVVIPNNPLQGIAHPDWSKVASGAFWFSAISIALVQGIETLLSAAAVAEKLDPYKRPCNLSRDVASVGAATMLSGLIGGLPMIAEIVRSTANVATGAKTRWSNFFHGLFLLAFVMLAAQFIDKIPNAALAALLIVVGYRLASPKVFKETYEIGNEQMIIFCVTILATLKTDLLCGVGVGILVKLLIHMYHGASIKELFSTNVTVSEPAEEHYYVTVSGCAVFSNYIQLKRRLDKIPRQKNLTVDLGLAHLVDHTVMHRLNQYASQYVKEGGQLELSGLHDHTAKSLHPLAMRKLQNAVQQ